MVGYPLTEELYLKLSLGIYMKKTKMEENAKSSTTSTCLNAGLEDIVSQDSGNDGSLPNPEPATKRIRMGLETGTSTDVSS